ncbi:uncharacterized protein BX663DRAFT_517266 [Cokeromyces recurvatus]|uniref:uncharacterized protein n=1 Tax=Cokeromyces recurvatus TaxID=90255 RepID=UPI0022203230|nr:uncharacterized protein BX663DRAFT_517266 [Cokeromyces recurvatus]KAI7900688.1 hypothetical protein BX663DRAFT_517266 [Cokeromyces recurvatus]
MSDTDIDSQAASSALVKSIIEDLFSYNAIKRKRILDYYFFQNATLSSPIMSTEGVLNIQYVYTVWQTMNRVEPKINNIVFDGQIAVVQLTQTISPCVFPSFIQFQIPAITTLYFKETDQESGLLKIYKQEDSWTLEGLLQSVPLVSFWYNHVVRLMVGKIVTATGDILDAAIDQAQKIILQAQEIQRIGRDMAIDSMEKLDEYKAEMHANYLQGVQNWRESYIMTSSHHDDTSVITEKENPLHHHSASPTPLITKKEYEKAVFH